MQPTRHHRLVRRSLPPAAAARVALSRFLPALAPLDPSVLQGARLHIGGSVVVSHPDWLVVAPRPGPIVDIVADTDALPAVRDGAVLEVYAAVERTDERGLQPMLREWHRVLACPRPGVPGAERRGCDAAPPGTCTGVLRLSVPDMSAVAGLLLNATLTTQVQDARSAARHAVLTRACGRQDRGELLDFVRHARGAVITMDVLEQVRGNACSRCLC